MRIGEGPHAARWRTALSAGAGVVALAVSFAFGASWSVAALIAWDAAAIVFLGLVWPMIRTKGAHETAALAGSEEGSRRESEALLLAAGTASLIAVVFTLARAGDVHHGQRVTLVLLSIASVALAWASIQTVYTLRYARLYFATPVGGLSFSSDDPPQYADFAYVAFTIGMTYQVSDTTIEKTALRRAVIQHALLSYLFGAVILAVAVSSVASLLGG